MMTERKQRLPWGLAGGLYLGGRKEDDREGGCAQAKGCLKSHYGLLSKFSIIIILMDLISLQFGAMMF
jgi:hypothetical protein